MPLTTHRHILSSNLTQRDLRRVFYLVPLQGVGLVLASITSLGQLRLEVSQKDPTFV